MRSVPVISSSRLGSETDSKPLWVLNTLKRGLVQILLWIILMIGIGIYHVFWVATPMFTSTTTITLLGQTADPSGLGQIIPGLGGDMVTINTEVEVLLSRDLTAQLVDELALIKDPEFNATLRPADPSLLKTMIGTTLNAILPSSRDQDEGPSERELRDRVIDLVNQRLRVRNERLSRVYHITFTSEVPEKAALIANTLAQLYIDSQIAVKFDATERATNWLVKRVEELKIELDQDENAVKRFNTETDLTGSEALAALNRQLKDFRNRIADTRASLTAATQQVADMVATQASGDLARMALAARDLALEEAAKRLAAGPDLGARQAFDTRFDALLLRARAQASRTQSQIAPLERQVVDLEREVEQQSSDLLKLQQLEREAEASRQIYEHFLSQLKETSIQKDVHSADSRVISTAVVPIIASSPRKGSFLIACALVGLVLGSGIVLLREMRKAGFRSAREIEQSFNITVLGQIPRAPHGKRQRILKYLTTHTTSALNEAVRNLRTSLLLSDVDKPPKVIMLTSSLPGEGKTTQSLALSQSFASMGRRVLLIEGDMRRRTFQQYFNVKNQPGLVTAVSTDHPLDDIVYHSDDLGVDVLLGESSTFNAADFFSSQSFQNFLCRVRAEYDVVIIDTPPVLVVPDARVIGEMSDAVIYVVRWDQTTHAQVEEGLNLLNSIGVKVLGVSLSQIDIRKAQSYGDKYGEVYSAYGSKYYNN